MNKSVGCGAAISTLNKSDGLPIQAGQSRHFPQRQARSLPGFTQDDAKRFTEFIAEGGVLWHATNV